MRDLVKLLCPTVVKLKHYPWHYACATPYQPGQVLCIKCGEALPNGK